MFFYEFCNTDDFPYLNKVVCMYVLFPFKLPAAAMVWLAVLVRSSPPDALAVSDFSFST